MMNIDAFNLDDVLGNAYQAVIGGSKIAAVNLIRQTIQAHPGVELVLRDRLDSLTAVREARRMPGDEREACHVTATVADLLKAALS